MATVTPLSVDALYRRCELNQLPFETTAELPPLDEIIGQERAVEAIQFGIGIHHDGFNLFALGPNGTGKYTAVAQFLNQKAPTETPPDDWCYVNNFDQTHKPQALRLPGGQATILRDKMKRLIEDLLTIIPGAFDSDEYQAQQKTIEEEFKERQTQALEELSEAALTKHIALIRTPSGFAFAPLKEGEVLKPEEFVKLPQQEQQIIENEVKNLQQTLQRIMEQVPQWQRPENQAKGPAR